MHHFSQLVSIITDETPIEQLRNRLLKEARREVSHTRKPKIALLREVFGRGRSGVVMTGICPCWSIKAVPGSQRPSRLGRENLQVLLCYKSHHPQPTWPATLGAVNQQHLGDQTHTCIWKMLNSSSHRSVPSTILVGADAGRGSILSQRALDSLSRR